MEAAFARPAEHFAFDHLAAINMPLGKLEEQLSGLPHGREVVAYCHGLCPVLSYEVVALPFRTSGLTVRRKESWLPKRRTAGLPVEEGCSR